MVAFYLVDRIERSKMTVLHLNILLHYYSRTDDYEMLKENKTRLDYAYELSGEGLLYTPPSTANENLFLITGYGRRAIEKILNYSHNKYMSYIK